MSKRTIVTGPGGVRGVRSRFRANVRGARPLGRRLFVERHALPLGKLIEVDLCSASMEKPFLSAIVTDESEPAITNEPFDGSARHSVLPFVLQ